MTVHEVGGTLRIDDTPGMHWVLAALFVALGCLFVLAPLGLAADADQLSWPVRALIGSVGAIAVSAGLWVLARAPRSRLIVDRASRSIRLNRWGLAGRLAREWPAEAARAVRVLARRDDEDAAVFQVHLVLRDEEAIAVSPVWQHGRDSIERAARRLAESLEVDVVR